MDSQNTEVVISSLPQENGWLSDEKAPLYCYHGHWYPARCLSAAIAISSPEGLPEFNPSSSDIIVCSTPKSGTTWLKALSFAISTRSRHAIDDMESHPLCSTLPHELIPSIEIGVAGGVEPRDRDRDLPLFTSHLPYGCLPAQVLANGCKIVNIWRDPKDAFISGWLFARKIRHNKDVTAPIPLDEAFQLFCRGVFPFGPYWDHVLGYWNASLDRPQSVLVLKYEDMKSDAEGNVKRLADFIGFPFSPEEVDRGVPAQIVELCSFKSLRNVVNGGGNFVSNEFFSIDKDSFYRNGKTGDWNNYLTQQMADEIDRITSDKLGTLFQHAKVLYLLIDILQ